LGNLISIIIIICWIAIVLISAIICRYLYPGQKELSRKIIHIGTGPVLPLAWVLKISSNIAIPVASIITLGLFINHRLRLLPAMEDINRQSYGTIAYGMSITILIICLWPEHAAAVSAGVLVMSFGDGLAGLIGPKWQSPDWIILGQRKSVIGTVTMALVALIVLFLIALISGITIHPLLLIVIATLAVILEQVGPWGIDNLTVPIGVAYAWLWFS
jgi:phytol kinase